MFRLLPSDLNLSPRARKIRDRLLVFVLFPLVLAMAAYLVMSEMDRREEQLELLSEAREIGGADLKLAELIPEHDPRLVQPCLRITEAGALTELAAFFPTADDADYGGHQTQQFRYKLRLRFGDGGEAVYLIRFYETYPDDVFLNRHNYEIFADGSYSYSLVPQIRVPRLLPWLRQRAVVAGCPIV